MRVLPSRSICCTVLHFTLWGVFVCVCVCVFIYIIYIYNISLLRYLCRRASDFLRSSRVPLGWIDLRLLALNLLRSGPLVVAVVRRPLARGPALSKVVHQTVLEVDDLGRFGIHVHVGSVALGRGLGKDLSQGRHDLLAQLAVRGEFHREQDVQVAPDKGVSVAGHALVGDDLDKGFSLRRLGLDDLSRLGPDDEIPTVQVLDLPLESAQGLVEGEVLGHQQIGPLSLEDGVLLLLDDEIDIPRFHVWFFVGLAAEDNLLLVLHTLFHQYFQDLALALFLVEVALAPARGTAALHLLDHAQGDLAELQDDPLAVTLVADLGISDNDLAGDGELDALAVVQILEGDLEGMVDVFSAAGTGAATPPAAAKEHAEEVLVGSASAAAVFESLEAVFVVFGAFFRIAQDLVGGINFLKGVLVSSLVGVVFDRHFSVRLLDGLLIGILFHLERFVQFRGVDIRRGSASTARSSPALSEMFREWISPEKHGVWLSSTIVLYCIVLRRYRNWNSNWNSKRKWKSKRK
mmetsp:Transcript_15094/g.41979  ORF Transcript_15094/g.41979 Transcript_15094/m.41979 type:complete len:519 (-) Transcript_15094:133-1689(-)